MLRNIDEKNQQNYMKLNQLDINIETLQQQHNELHNKLHNLSLKIKSKKHEQICNMCKINSIINHINLCKILIDSDNYSKHINDTVNYSERKLKQELQIINSSIKELRDKNKFVNQTMTYNNNKLEELYKLKLNNDKEIQDMKKQYITYNNIHKRNVNICSKINQIIQ